MTSRSRSRPTRPAQEDPEARVHVEHRQGGVLVDEQIKEPVERLPQRGEARVRVGGSVTQNMGDYNSIRVLVEIERPCPDTEMHIDETYKQVSEKVEEFLNSELDMATGAQD